MKHFDDGSWADFVRDMVSSEMRAEMQQHLDSGCKDCEQTALIWQGVYTAGRQEGQYSPPVNAVRVAKSQFAGALLNLSAATTAKLVFDSYLQPATGGFRGAVAARQFLYEAGEFFVDLRFEPEKETARVLLVGQVLNRARQAQGATGVMVRLLKGVLPVANTATNEFGEFQLEFDAGQDFSLAIGMDEEKVIVLPLPGLKSKWMEVEPPRSSLRGK